MSEKDLSSGRTQSTHTNTIYICEENVPVPVGCVCMPHTCLPVLFSGSPTNNKPQQQSIQPNTNNNHENMEEPVGSKHRNLMHPKRERDECPRIVTLRWTDIENVRACARSLPSSNETEKHHDKH